MKKSQFHISSLNHRTPFNQMGGSIRGIVKACTVVSANALAKYGIEFNTHIINA